MSKPSGEGYSVETLIASLRRNGISDEPVLSAISRVPREAFVDAALASDAYADEALPIACRQTISQPFVVAYMTQALELQPHHCVLEIGTGSGYQAAILSQLCRQVRTIERYADLHRSASERLSRLGYRNVLTKWGDGYAGWPEAAPFDRILVTAAATELPKALLAQLAPDGVMVLPMGASIADQYIHRLRNRGGAWDDEKLIAVRFVPMLAGTAR
ncbi:MAG: protein-L-isoaspartate(D-aspartate) O-methyltransferase [Hyphomicrobiaceae bacterium]